MENEKDNDNVNEKQQQNDNNDTKEAENESSSILDIELENNSGGDSQLEPGEVKDDDDDDDIIPPNSNSLTIPMTTMGMGIVSFSNNFHNKFTNVNLNSSQLSEKRLAAAIIGKEIAKRRLKSLGNFKKIQMESKNYMTPQNQKNRKHLDNYGIKTSLSGIANPMNKKGKPPTAHEKAKLTKEEIEQMKKREDRALPCLYYDATMIHRIRADSPNKSISKNSEINMKTSSLEAIKNYHDNDDDHNNDDCDKNVTMGSKTSSSSSTSSKHRNYKKIDDSTRRSSPTIAKRKLVFSNKDNQRRYSNPLNMKHQKDFITRKSHHNDNNNHYHQKHFSHHFNYQNNKRFSSNRFSVMASRDKFNTNKNKFKLMYTKTKPVISYAFNPNIAVDKNLHFPSPSPSLSASSSTIATNVEDDNSNKYDNNINDNDNDDLKIMKNKKTQKNSLSTTSSVDMENENDNDSYLSSNQEHEDSNIENIKKKKDQQQLSQKELSRKLRKLQKSKYMIKQNKKIDKIIKKIEIKPSFEGYEDDEDLNENNEDLKKIDDEDEKNSNKEKNDKKLKKSSSKLKQHKITKKIEIKPSFEGYEEDGEDDDDNYDNQEINRNKIADDETFIEEEITEFPLSKDEATISGIVGKRSSLVSSENTKNAPVIAVASTDNKSPDTDDYMANWEEDEETINLFESSMTTTAKTTTKTIMEKVKIDSDEINFSTDNETDIFYDSGIATTNSTKSTDYISDIIESDTEDGEIKDGLGTPIFVNPSPPAEILQNNDDIVQKLTQQNNNLSNSNEITTFSKQNKDSSNMTKESILYDNAEFTMFRNKSQISSSSSSSDITPSTANLKTNDNSISKSKVSSSNTHLFGMQHIYEQFIQSVNEAGIDLSSEGHPSVDKVIVKEKSLNNVDDNDNSSKSEIFNELQQQKQNTIINIQQRNSPIRTPPLLSVRRSSTSSTSSSSSSSSSSSTSSSENSSSSTSSSSTSSSSSSSSSTISSPQTSPYLAAAVAALLNDNDGKHIKTTVKNDDNNISSEGNEYRQVKLSSEDEKRIRVLQKRRKMLKKLQKQSEELDDNDKQCLLGVKKLIEAEQALLMRKFNLTTLENLLGKGSSDDDDDDNNDNGESGKNKNKHNYKSKKGEKCIKNVNETKDQTTHEKDDGIKNEEISDHIFGTNREAIKVKILMKSKTGTQIKHNQKVDTETSSEQLQDAEDQDFTEKLMKPKRDKNSLSRDFDGSGNGELSSHRSRSRRRSRSHSRSRSFSPRNYSRSGNYKSRSLSGSPDRYHRRFSPQSSDRKGGRRTHSKRNYRTPSPRRSRRGNSPSDYRRNGHRRSRYSSPSTSRRSRSPYGGNRQSSNSPLRFRPPSPTTTPPQNSRESSRERSKSPCYSPDPLYKNVNGDNVNWDTIDHIPPEYYLNGPESYFYLTPPSINGNMDASRSKSLQRSYSQLYHNYTQYNPYSGGYTPNSAPENGFQSNFGNEYISNPNLMLSYSKIPVIGTHSTDHVGYYYSNVRPNQSISTTTDNLVNSQGVNKEITSGKSSTFVVQKGNVLEIVPASVIPSAASNTADGKVTGQDSASPIKTPSKKKLGKKKKRRSSWEEEVARRHLRSAVTRLNKENDGIIRGILCHKIEIDIQQKEKKKVLFADGVPPGKSSSSEDEAITRNKKAQKKKKKKQKTAEENKENESSTDQNSFSELKIDPELENLPPPPPPPGSPPPHLEQPIPIRRQGPENLLYFHYDVVVNAMYVSHIPTPIPPRIMNMNSGFRLNPAAIDNTTMQSANSTPPPLPPPPSSSAKNTNNSTVNSTPCISAVNAAPTSTKVKNDSCEIDIKCDTSTTNDNRNVSNEGEGVINKESSKFEENNSVQDSMIQNQIPSPVVRNLSSEQKLIRRPSPRNSSRTIRTNLLPLTPGPVQPNRPFQQCRTPIAALSPVPSPQDQSSQSSSEDSSSSTTKNSPPILGKAIPSIIGKVVSQTPPVSSISYNGSSTPPQQLARSQNSFYGPIQFRPPRNFTPHPPSPLITQQFGNGSGGGTMFNQHSPVTGNSFIQQQQKPHFRPIPVLQSCTSTINEGPNTTNFATINARNPSPLIYPLQTSETNPTSTTVSSSSSSSSPSSLLQQQSLNEEAKAAIAKEIEAV